MLLLVYVIIELINHKLSHKSRDMVEMTGWAATTFGALAGAFIHGFSVLASTLYSRGVITLGALLAVFLATSDESIPLILSKPDKIHLLWPILGTKLVIAIFFGYAVDIFYRKKKKVNHDDDCLEEKGCCGQHLDNDKLSIKEIIYHPFVHMVKVFLFVFVVSVGLGYLLSNFSHEEVSKYMMQGSVLQPFMTALIGLIPNCAASVMVTELYLSGNIGFGSIIAGLSTGAGLGLLVLFKENKSKVNTLKIVLMLVLISTFCGILLQYIYE